VKSGPASGEKYLKKGNAYLPVVKTSLALLSLPAENTEKNVSL